MKLVGVYPLGKDIPRYPVSTIFLVPAQALQALRALRALQVLQVLPFLVPAQVLQALQVLRALRALQVLPSPVLEVSIGCSQST
ncbi:MAG: hypothetical protein ABSC55_25980 [Syntrophorhabdales bacterium]|jgi:hypothetical protein